MKFDDFLVLVIRSLCHEDRNGFHNSLSLPSPHTSHPAALEVVYDPTRTRAEKPSEILIGLGDWVDENGLVNHQGICLNHKGMGSRFKQVQNYTSLTELILNPPPKLTTDWNQRVGKTPDIKQLLSQLTLIVEDVGPDSCFAFLCWLAIICGVDKTEIIQRKHGAWLNALHRWETTGLCEDPYTSWAALLSALSHSYVQRTYSQQTDDSSSSQVDLTAAWCKGLKFTATLLQRDIDPNAVPNIPDQPAYTRAIAFMKSEYQDYRETLDKTTRLQLLVPMAGSGDTRQLLVDAYFAVENWPSGSKKIFIRKDVDHTYTQQGFALMGLYRPLERGSGNDMTLSVNPETGIYLKKLWLRLEQLETEQWKGQRPNTNARPIVSYKEQQGYTQPWWDDSGRYTLLGAPKEDKAHAISGTRLQWETVVNAAWHCYNPLRKLKFINLLNGEQACSLENCTPVSPHPLNESRKVCGLIAVRWIPDNINQQSLFLCPTAKRYFAALIARGQDTHSIDTKHLPTETDFDFIQLSGGFAVIHGKGVFLFDDWQSEDLKLQPLQDELKAVFNLFITVLGVDEKLEKMILGNPFSRQKLAQSMTVLSQLTELRADLAKTRHHYASKTEGEDVLRFRKQLESRWGIENLVDDFYKRIADIEDTYKTLSTLRTQSFVSIIASYGLPFFVSGAVIGMISPWIKKTLVSCPVGIIALTKVLSYVLLTLILIGVIRIGQKIYARTVNSDQTDASDQ